LAKNNEDRFGRYLKKHIGMQYGKKPVKVQTLKKLDVRKLGVFSTNPPLRQLPEADLSDLGRSLRMSL
jgi:hypothetical protein